MADLASRYAEQTKGTQRVNTGRFGGFAGPTETKVAKPTQYVNKGLPGPFQKISDVSRQAVDIGFQGAATGLNFVKNTGVDIFNAAKLATKTFTESRTQPILNRQYEKASQQLSYAQDRVVSDYKAGRMNKTDYTKALQDISGAFQQISDETKTISEGPTPLERALAVSETAVNALSLGSLKLSEVGGKQAFEAGSKEAIKSLIDDAANPLEKLIMKVPAVRDLIERNLTQAAKREGQKLAGETAGQFIGREARNIAADLLIKRPIFYQSNIGGGKEVYDKILSREYGSAIRTSAWLGSQMLSGGPIGAFFKGAGWLKGGIRKLAYGKASFIDEISKRIGNGNPSQIARFLKTLEQKAPGEYKEAEKTFRILQETNLRAANDRVDTAVENVLTHYAQNEEPLESLTPAKIYKHFKGWAESDSYAQTLIKSGKLPGVKPEDASKFVVVRWDQATKKALADKVATAGNKAQQRATVLAMADRPGVGWGNNDILMKRIQSIINRSKNADEAAKEIRAITTASTAVDLPKDAAKYLGDRGFTIARPSAFGGRRTPIVTYDETRKLISSAIDGNTAIFDPATAPNPIVSSIANGLKRAGLSPEAANEIGSRKLAESLVSSLDEAGAAGRVGITKGKDVVNGGRAILSSLQNYIENKPAAFGLGRNSAISDIRQLTLNEISDALKVSKSEARAISQAIMDGYTRTPLEFRGLGDKIVDGLYSINPFQKYYSRIQSALRYTYNPFFRTQERVETKLLSHGQANNLIWNRSRSELDNATRVLDEGGIFTSSLPGEAAQDQVLGRITANVTQGQKRDLAGLAMNIADARGIPLEQLVKNHTDEVDDALRVVIQYPRKGILASPLARTMNLMFFPMRYNAKVTMLAAKVLAKQPPSVQLAILNSGFKMRDWLKSDEGIAWQAEHADAIQVFNWITPVNSLSYTMNLLANGPESVGELGQLGGLPLGFITQMLDSQGVIHINKPYVNPKTGDVIPDYIPKTTQARASVALSDLLGSMFTYPGRTLGLPGKEATLKKIVAAFIDTNGTQFDKNIREEDLTPLQKNWIRVLKGDTSKEAVDALYNSPAPGQFNWYTLPPTELPVITRPTTKQSYEQRKGLPSGKRAKRRKKTALAIPQR